MPNRKSHLAYADFISLFTFLAKYILVQDWLSPELLQTSLPLILRVRVQVSIKENIFALVHIHIFKTNKTCFSFSFLEVTF